MGEQNYKLHTFILTVDRKEWSLLALAPLKVEVKFFPVHAMKACRRRRGIAPLILNLSTRWR
jgi:hypothetical protein